jgi:hypothetical protein
LKFNTDRFLSNLTRLSKEKDEENNKKKSCMGIVLKHMWYHDHHSEVNFEKFSLQDIKDAKEEVSVLPLQWDDSGESFICNPSNALVIIDQLSDIPDSFIGSKNKIFKIEEDDIFL